MVACIDYLCPDCGNEKCETCGGKGSLRLPAGTILTKTPTSMLKIRQEFEHWFDTFYKVDDLSRDCHPDYDIALTAFMAGWFRRRDA